MAEEKLDEFFHDLSYRESGSKSPPRRGRNMYSDNHGEFRAMALELTQILNNHKDQRHEKEEEKQSPSKKPKNQTTHDYIPQHIPNSNNDADRLAWESATTLSNSPPCSSFVIYSKDRQENERMKEHLGKINTNQPLRPADGDYGAPLFDGGVANATPPTFTGVAGRVSLSGGSGTILHFACVMDSPMALAICLLLGAQADTPHTAFRRKMVHEAACSGSVQCLEVLLRLGKRCKMHLNSINTSSHANGSRVTESVPTGIFFPVLAPCSKTYSTKSDSMSLPFAKKESNHQTESLSSSYLTTLRTVVEVLERVRTGEITELEAAMSLLLPEKLSDASILSLSKTCSFAPNVDSLRPLLSKTSTRMYGYSDGHGNTPLHWAAFKNEQRCVSLLLRYNADVNTRAHPTGWTPLHDGAYSNAAESVALLIDAGANVDALASSGATPLCFAAQEDAYGAAKVLLDRGADVTARCCGQQPSLLAGTHHIAPNSFHHHHPGRFSGYTPLHYCAHYNAHRAARVLLESAASLVATEVPDFNDRLPIHIAAARGSSDVLRELLHSGARVDSMLISSPRSSLSRSLECNGTVSPRPHARQGPGRMITESSSPHPVVGLAGAVAGNQQPLASTPPTTAPSPFAVVVTPVQSPVLRSMIPSRPITSSKPWNCLSQRSIDECRGLITVVEQNWAPSRHSLFTPTDRRAVVELLRVGKRFEQMGTGIFLDLWPEVLSFCGRGWFETAACANGNAVHPSTVLPLQDDDEESMRSDSDHMMMDITPDGSPRIDDDMYFDNGNETNEHEFYQFHLDR